MDQALRSEVRFVTTRLGGIVREQAGDRVFEAIEKLRRLAKEMRERADMPPDGPQREVERLEVAEASSVAHAFSLFFHLVNVCEERQRIRRLHAYDQQEGGAPMSLRHTFRELRRQHIPVGALAALLRSARIEPVLTAHPTEAKRRSVLNHIVRIARTLDELNGNFGAGAERLLDRWIEALWLTDEIRERPITPEIEVENVLVYLERTIYELAPRFWQRLEDELAHFAPEVKLPPPFLAFGSWVGADRDGNPNVTAETSLRAAEEYRKSVLRHYRECCRRMIGVLSLRPPPGRLENRLRRSIAADMQRFPATRPFADLDQPAELYRRKLRVMIWRLERAAGHEPGGYSSAAEFAADIELLRDTLEKQRAPRLVRWGPEALHTTHQVFGLHGVSMEFRQHAGSTRAAAGEILAAAGLPGEPESERIRSIHRLIQQPAARPADLSPATQQVLDEFETLKCIQERNGPEAAHRYILSMASSAADVWDLLLLGARTGMLASDSRQRLAASFDVIPLFETYDDLHQCPQVLDAILSDSSYRQLLRHSRGDRQEVMLGYSDSVKDSGYFAANWALFRAQKLLSQVAEQHGVQLTLFHGKGGTIDRGGGLSYRMVQAQPFAAPGGHMRITEQGEVISFKYSNPQIAQRNIEELVTSVLDAHLLHPRHGPAPARLARWEEFAEELAVSSRRYYTELVYETPEFPKYFFQATPIDLIERLRLGSRPSRRYQTDDIRALRAIPWVFAWTQSRHFLPSWYGVGSALESFASNHAEKGLEWLQEMYAGWPFFAVLIDNAEISLAKTDLSIAGRYAALVRPSELGRRIFGRIEQEYERSRCMVQQVTGLKRLLEHHPVLAESIRLRNPYVDPLNFIQIHFLDQWRRSRRPQSELLHLLQITVSGIAFGMKSTG